jgi:hypothetical protein
MDSPPTEEDGGTSNGYGSQSGNGTRDSTHVCLFFLPS